MAGRHRIARIKWSYPRSLEKVNGSIPQPIDSSWGVYAIYRSFGDKLTLLYIGKTFSNYDQRLKEHLKFWIKEYRGAITVRFGSIIFPENVTSEILDDIESGLIYELNPIANSQKTVSYVAKNFYRIENLDYRGSIPKIISMHEH